MPSRYYQRNFVKGYFYHVYNRGANKEIVFKDENDYFTFINILAYYLRFPLGKPYSISIHQQVPNLKMERYGSIELSAYCLMPNHFHLLVKQIINPLPQNSISNLMRRLTITYAMYFQNKYDHSGTIFQGKFKNILVESDIQLLQLSKYIHKNPKEILGSEPIENYKFSSYKLYIGNTSDSDWINTQPILSLFNKINPHSSYKKFVEEISQKNIEESIEGLTLE